MDFDKYSKEAIELINKELKNLLEEWRRETGKIDKSLLPLVDKFIESCKGGKRIRGVLVVLGYELGNSSADYRLQSTAKRAEVGRPKSEDIIKVAAAYEIFHSAVLAHDDIIDQSSIRRGRPSLHQALGKGHSGQSRALILGDAGFFLATRIISESNFPKDAKLKALNWFSQIMLDTAIGELMDVEKADALMTIKLKTARYSIAGPLVLGAVLGGGKQGLIRGFTEFGENLGIAFQIRDDILGVFGLPAATGKSITSDVEEGKNTLLYNYALRNVDTRQRQVLAKYYGQGVLGARGLEEVRQVFQETGALDYAKKEADRYKVKAMEILPKLTKDHSMSKILEQLAGYLVQRTK